MNMKLEEAVAKAKKLKSQGGVGSTSTKISCSGNDSLGRLHKRTEELLKKLEYLNYLDSYYNCYYVTIKRKL